MVKDETDIAIVGAGPAGLIAAREAAKMGVDVTVFEEHEEIGIPCHCAGLLSIKGLREIDLPQDERFVQNKVRGAHFFSPAGLSFTVEREEPVACVLNRIGFDEFLAEQARQAGVNFRLGRKVQSIKRLNGKILLIGDFGAIRADIIVDAEGVASRLIKDVGLQPLSVRDLLPALQYDLKGVEVDPEYVEVYTGRKLAPSFFAWVIPLNESSVRVGLASREDSPRQKLERFIKVRFHEGKGLARVYTRSGVVVTCGPIPKTFHDSFIAVGDVAGQVKPTTGGGVVWGGICAMIAGRVAAEAVGRGDLTQRFLRRYEVSWRRRLDREVRFALLARRIADRLSDRTIDKVFEVIIGSSLQRELSLEGDMDFQAGTILKVARRKDVLKILVSSASDLLGYLRG